MIHNDGRPVARIAPRRASRSVRRLAALLVAVGSAAGLTAATGWLPTASAHTQLVSTQPAAGSRIDSAPTEVRLSFNDRLVPQFNTASLRIDDGTEQTVSSTVTNTDLVVELPAPAPAAGNWSVTWRVVAQDGHPITGVLAFLVGPATPGAESPTPSSPAGATAPSAPSQGPGGGAPQLRVNEPNPAIAQTMLGGGVLAVAALAVITVMVAGRYNRRPAPADEPPGLSPSNEDPSSEARSDPGSSDSPAEAEPTAGPDGS